MTLLQDLRYAARMLWRSPTFTIVAVLALALGIGATSAIYSVVDAVMLRPLPFPKPEQLAQVTSLLRARHGASSYPDYLDFAARNHTMQALAAYKGASAVLTGESDPQQEQAVKATPSLFRVLDVPMALGRTFSNEEGRPDSHVVLISNKLWKDRYRGDANIVGRQIQIDREPYTIIGVLPAHFQWPLDDGDATALVLPYPQTASDANEDKNRGSHSLSMVGRLKPGVTAGQAQLDFDTMTAQLQKEFPEEDEHLTALVESLREVLIGPTRQTLTMWLVAVLCVLLIACANVAGLLLARATVRQREISIRVALGAGRWRIVRQMLTESVLLGVVGGAVGMLLSLWLVDLLVAMVMPSLPRVHDLNVDGRVLGVTFGLAVVTGVIFGLVPALHASKPELNDALKETARSTAHARSRHARNALLVGEIAGALLLLVAAGVTLRSFAKLSHTDPGFRVDDLAVAQMMLPQNRYAENENVDAYRTRLEAEVRLIPGMMSEAVGAPLPFSNADMTVGINPVGQKANAVIPNARYVSVSPAWFDTLGIPLIAGRTFNSGEDRLKGPNALVVSKVFAERMWPGENAVGKHVAIGICATNCEGEKEHVYEVIGVAGEIHHDKLDQAFMPTMYTAYGHIPIGFVSVVARTPHPEAIESALRRAILAADKDLPPPLIGTMRTQLSESMRSQKVLMVLLGLFALVALILAVIGVYGVMSYTVTQRTREIGIRVALGAGSTEIVTMVLAESLRLSLMAAALGIIGAVGGGRLLESQLYGVTGTDPMTIGLVTLGMLIVCLLASFLPARRASKVDPMVALRYE